MELTNKRIRVNSEQTVYKLFPVGDLHLGSMACDQPAAEWLVKRIARDPHAYWIGLGDYSDAILPSDPRWQTRGLDWERVGKDAKGVPDVGDLANVLVEQVDQFFSPIWDKCIGLHTGNHELTLSKHYYIDLTRRLCKKYNVPYLGQTAITRLCFEGNKWASRFDVFSEHGATGGGTDGNAINDALKRANQFEADIYLKAHIHKKGFTKKTLLSWGPRSLQSNTKLFVLTGTYLRGLMEGELTYSESRGLAPNELGSMAILIRPRQRFLEAVDVNAMALFER